MWESILGGLIGAVVGALTGGAITYYRERKLERERKHEETLRKLYNKLDRLRSLIFTVLAVGKTDSDSELEDRGIYPRDIHALANEIKMVATQLNDYHLKKRAMKVMTGDFDSHSEMEEAIIGVLKEVREEAYPVLDEVREENRHINVTVRKHEDGTVERVKKWGGPATYKFLDRIREMGVSQRSEGEQDST